MVFTIAQIKKLIYLALYTMYERWQLIALPMIIVPIAVIAISLSSEKQYTNHATILIEESALLNPFLDELEFSFELSARMDALRTLVLSRKNLTEVVKEVGLVDDLTNQLEVEKMQQKLASAISISLVGDELVRIHFKWNKRQQMKPVLEALVEKFIERLLAPTKASLDTSETFLKNQLEELRLQLELAEDKLAKFKRDNRESLPELLNVNQDTLARLEQEKQQKLVDLSGAKARLATLKKQLAKANPVKGRLVDSIMRIEADIALLRTRYTDQHSKVQAKLRELETLQIRKQEIESQAKPFEEADLDSLWQIANSLPLGANAKDSALLVAQLITLEEAENNVAQLKNEIEMLSEQLSVVSTRLSSSSEIDKALRQLQRDYQVKQTLYSEMLERYEMSKVTGQLVRYEGPDKVKTIERAYSPTSPINQSLVVSIILGIVLGLFSAAALTFVAMITDLRVRDEATIETIAGQRVLTKLPIVNDVTVHRID
ncbi:GNVR domain-containing protein [Pseudoalteromonas sp. MMG024]|uniref:GumC family protein n=1 Tax=Pseudoalteromonas sp. MMG024 TaxID=2909980 RepID=UPI001F3CEC7A|nr:GNVR domain-containing protein [Pseudoalteromonas sp. MMG024]MCF6457455.1 sugar transporter [Pseudoalteromonas sp. MMG024]